MQITRTNVEALVGVIDSLFEEGEEVLAHAHRWLDAQGRQPGAEEASAGLEQAIEPFARAVGEAARLLDIEN